MQRAIIKFALIVPSGHTVKSLPMLFVASLVSHAGLQNSANLGRNALFSTEGMHSSKKFVRTMGEHSWAILEFAQTVKGTSRSFLSLRIKSRQTCTSPVTDTFCVPKMGVPLS